MGKLGSGETCDSAFSIDKGKLLKSVLKKAKGYVVKEYVEEYNVVDGDVVLTKKKVSTKDIPPDMAAIKLLLESSGAKQDITFAELEKERKELTEQFYSIRDKNKGEENGIRKG